MFKNFKLICVSFLILFSFAPSIAQSDSDIAKAARHAADLIKEYRASTNAETRLEIIFELQDMRFKHVNDFFLKEAHAQMSVFNKHTTSAEVFTVATLIFGAASTGIPATEFKLDQLERVLARAIEKNPHIADFKFSVDDSKMSAEKTFEMIFENGKRHTKTGPKYPLLPKDLFAELEQLNFPKDRTKDARNESNHKPESQSKALTTTEKSTALNTKVSMQELFDMIAEKADARVADALLHMSHKFSFESVNEALKLITINIEKYAENYKAIEIENAEFSKTVENALKEFSKRIPRGNPGREGDKVAYDILQNRLERTRFLIDYLSDKQGGQQFHTLTDKLNAIEEALRTYEKSGVPTVEFNGQDYLDNKQTETKYKSRLPEPRTWMGSAAEATDKKMIKIEDKAEIEKIQNHIERNVIEQPEVKPYLVDSIRLSKMKKMILSDSYNKKHGLDFPKPELFVTIGLPGAGKDTIAENLVDGLHGYKGAYHKHLYRMNVINDSFSMSAETGSGTGFVGSGGLPPIVRFMVLHSSGKYMINKQESPGGTKYSVELNPAYEEWVRGPGKNGAPMPGYFTPSEGLIFINEFHNWSKTGLDKVAKQLIERGIFKIQSPNGGLSTIQVPVRIQMASNHGIHLLASRNADGTRRGEFVSNEKLVDNWEKNSGNKPLLKEALLHILAGTKFNGEHQPGISEELLNRISAAKIFLLYPISAKGVQKIAEVKLKALARELKDTRNLGELRVTWKPNFVKMIQGIDYIPEEMARPLDGKIDSMVLFPLNKYLLESNIEFKQNGHDIVLDIVRNKDGTYSLEIENDGKKELVPIESTKNQKYVEMMSPEQKKRFGEVESIINKRVFGVQMVAKQLAEAIWLQARGINRELKVSDANLPKPQVFGMFGPTGNGKTRSAKAFVEALSHAYGDKYEMLRIDMDTIKTSHDLQRVLTGSLKAGADEIKSEFFQAHENSRGRLVVVIDELANLAKDPSRQHMLSDFYRFFDESKIDMNGKMLIMGRVTFLITGNAGEEWYKGIPAEVPFFERMLSWMRIYKDEASNPRNKQILLEKYFPQALLGRMTNIFFLPPFTFRALREVTQEGVRRMLESMVEDRKTGTEGWRLSFRNAAEFFQLVGAVERFGFELEKQGRSVEGFIDNVKKQVYSQLVNKVDLAVGQNVLISVDKEATSKSEAEGIKSGGQISPKLHLNLQYYANGNVAEPVTHKVEVEGKGLEIRPRARKVDQVLTAYHEVGHELVRKVYFSDTTNSRGISIVPGVAKFGANWIYYAGIARWEEHSRVPKTKGEVLRRMAISFGGEIAQRVVTGMSDAGQSQDYQGIAELLKRAILEWGLAPEVFKGPVAERGANLDAFMAQLGQKKSAEIRAEMERWIQESRQMARNAILANYSNIFVPQSKLLAEKGDVTGAELDRFYEKNPVLAERNAEGVENPEFKKLVESGTLDIPNQYKPDNMKKQAWHTKLLNSVRQLVTGKKVETLTPRDAQGLHPDLMPKHVTLIEDIVNKERAADIAKVREIKVPLWDSKANPQGEAVETTVKQERSTERNMTEGKSTPRATPEQIMSCLRAG